MLLHNTSQMQVKQIFMLFLSDNIFRKHLLAKLFKPQQNKKNHDVFKCSSIIIQKKCKQKIILKSMRDNTFSQVMLYSNFFLAILFFFCLIQELICALNKIHNNPIKSQLNWFEADFLILH